MRVVRAEELTRAIEAILRAAGTSEENVRIVANNLVESNLAGVDSHGVFRLPLYIDKILESSPSGRRRRLVPNAEVRVDRESATTAVIDGGWGFGQVVAKRGMELAIRKAEVSGVGVVTGRNCFNVGRLGAYSLMAARSNLIGIMYGHTAPAMSLVGVRGKLIGTNPMSYAIPAREEQPIVLDFASSAAAGGKITVAIDKGTQVPEGWIVDENGNPTTDPTLPHLMLPFGGHKGYAMAVVIEALAGILSGGGVLADLQGVNSFFTVALNPESFMSVEEFKGQVDSMIRGLRKLSPSIVIPGEPEFRMREERVRDGIAIPEPMYKRLAECARRVGVDLDF